MPIGRFATAEPINKTAPTGGVSKPIPQFNINIIPYWIGSIPVDTAIGSRIGVVIRIIGDISIIMPKNNKIRLINSLNTIGFSVTLISAFAASSGTFNRVRQYPNTLEVAIKINTIDKMASKTNPFTMPNYITIVWVEEECPKKESFD